VRGVSEGISWTCSSGECRLTEDVSVLLLLSASVMLWAFGCKPAEGPTGVALPVMRRFLNASTSIEARMFLLSAGAGAAFSGAWSFWTEGRKGSSIVASVRLNGLAGTPGIGLLGVTVSGVCSVSVLSSSLLLESFPKGSSSFAPNSAGNLREKGVEGVSW
jgi:hypothetical protein